MSMENLIEIQFWCSLFVGLLGLLGNFICIVTFIRSEMIKCPSTIFLINLAISDILVILIRIWFTYDIWLPDEDSLSLVMTVFGIFAHVITTTHSVYCTLIITADRCIAVLDPIRTRQLCTKKSAILVSTFVFLLCVLTYVLILGYIYHYNFAGGDLVEFYSLHLEDIDWIRLVLLFLIPYPILIVLNAIIVYKVRKFMRTRSEMVATSMSKEIRDTENALTRMMLAVILVFGLTFTPYCLYLFAVDVFHVYPADWVMFTVLFLSWLNNSVNCIIYFALGKQFRKSFELATGKCLKCWIR